MYIKSIIQGVRLCRLSPPDRVWSRLGAKAPAYGIIRCCGRWRHHRGRGDQHPGPDHGPL